MTMSDHGILIVAAVCWYFLQQKQLIDEQNAAFAMFAENC